MRTTLSWTTVFLFFAILSWPAGAQMKWDAKGDAWKEIPPPSDAQAEPGSVEAAYMDAYALMQKGKFKTARARLTKLLKKHPRTVLRDKIEFRIAECLYYRREYTDSYEMLQRIVLPAGHPLAQDVLELEMSVAEALLRGGKMRLFKIFTVSGAGYGENILRRVIDRNPHGPYADDALFLLANFFFDKRRYPEAAMNYEFITKNYPASTFAPESEFYENRSYFLSNKGVEYDTQPLIEAQDGYQFMLKRISEGKLADQARADLAAIDERLAEKLWRVGEFYLLKRQGPSAATYYRALLRNYPSSKHAVDAQRRLDELARLSLPKEDQPEDETKEK